MRAHTIASIFVSLLLCGCGGVLDYELRHAEKVCEPHGGIKVVFATVFPGGVDVLCRDNTRITAFIDKKSK